MKKQTSKKLNLSRDTIRNIQDGSLNQVRGGAMASVVDLTCTCSQGWLSACQTGCCKP